MDARLFVIMLAACHPAAPHQGVDAAVPESPPAPTTMGEDASAALAPLAPAGGWLQTVSDDAGVPTYIGIPMGATTRRPIVVGLHGAQDHPDWACAEWFGALGGRAFIVCPRGSPLLGAWAWTSVDQIASKSEAAIALVRSLYGPWVSGGPALYGGWSQAATLGALVIAKRPDLFDAAVLVELGHTPLDASAVASSLRKAHVRGAAVVCATSSCEQWAKMAEPAMKGVPFSWSTAGHRGHVFDGEVAARVFEAIRFVEGSDAVWAPLLEAR